MIGVLSTFLNVHMTLTMPIRGWCIIPRIMLDNSLPAIYTKFDDTVTLAPAIPEIYNDNNDRLTAFDPGQPG